MFGCADLTPQAVMLRMCDCSGTLMACQPAHFMAKGQTHSYADDYLSLHRAVHVHYALHSRPGYNVH